MPDIGLLNKFKDAMLNSWGVTEDTQKAKKKTLSQANDNGNSVFKEFIDLNNNGTRETNEAMLTYTTPFGSDKTTLALEVGEGSGAQSANIVFDASTNVADITMKSCFEKNPLKGFEVPDQLPSIECAQFMKFGETITEAKIPKLIQEANQLFIQKQSKD